MGPTRRQRPRYGWKLAQALGTEGLLRLECSEQDEANEVREPCRG